MVAAQKGRSAAGYSGRPFSGSRTPLLLRTTTTTSKLFLFTLFRTLTSDALVCSSSTHHNLFSLTMATKATTAAVVRPLATLSTPNLHNSRNTNPQDFTRIYSSLGLGKGTHFPRPTPEHILITPHTFVRTETVAALQAFRKRNSDAQRIAGQLKAQPTTVDLAHYRSVLKNKAIVDEAEKIIRDFKPVTYDVGTHLKAIETFETNAVRDFLALPLFSSFFLFFERFVKLSDCKSEGNRGENRRRAEGPPSYAFQHPGCAPLRRSHRASYPFPSSPFSRRRKSDLSCKCRWRKLARHTHASSRQSRPW